MIAQNNIKNINTIGLAAAAKASAANPIVRRGLILFCTHCSLGLAMLYIYKIYIYIYICIYIYVNIICMLSKYMIFVEVCLNRLVSLNKIY